MDIKLPNTKSLNIIKNYPAEILVYILLVLVLGLAGWQYKSAGDIKDLQTEMKTYLRVDQKTVIEAIDRNTETNTRVVEVLIDLKKQREQELYGTAKHR
jgi:hypothetical protein